MKLIYFRLISTALCLTLLCGCAAGNNTAENGSNAPQTGNISTENQNQNTPNESGEGDTTAPLCSPLPAEDLQDWEDLFNARENNGLLRFPYAGLADDPYQIAPHLWLLFYDLGDPESEFSAEEIELLTQAGFSLELDATRLTRTFLTEYLLTKLNIPAGVSENLLDMWDLTYLLEYDAWYMSHGDTNLCLYEFDRGEWYDDGTVKLYYRNDFLSTVNESGEKDYVDANMVITLAQKNGEWYVLAHEIVEIPG